VCGAKCISNHIVSLFVCFSQQQFYYYFFFFFLSDLYDKGLNQIPESIGNLVALTTMCVFYDNFKFCQFFYVYYRDFGGNHLTSLPESIGNLPVLTTLFQKLKFLFIKISFPLYFCFKLALGQPINKHP
jgi:hypothetical protein